MSLIQLRDTPTSIRTSVYISAKTSPNRRNSSYYFSNKESLHTISQVSPSSIRTLMEPQWSSLELFIDSMHISIDIKSPQTFIVLFRKVDTISFGKWFPPLCTRDPTFMESPIVHPTMSSSSRTTSISSISSSIRSASFRKRHWYPYNHLPTSRPMNTCPFLAGMQ